MDRLKGLTAVVLIIAGGVLMLAISPRPNKLLDPDYSPKVCSDILSTQGVGRGMERRHNVRVSCDGDQYVFVLNCANNSVCTNVDQTQCWLPSADVYFQAADKRSVIGAALRMICGR